MVGINTALNNRFKADFTGKNKLSSNLIVAGDFGNNPWQRGTAFVNANVLQVADGFRMAKAGTLTGVIDINKVADAPTVFESGIYSTACLEFTVTTAQASIASGDALSFEYRMEGYDFSNIAQRPFVISFWVKSSKTGVYCVSVRDGLSIPTESYVAEITINAADVWEKKAVVIPATPVNGSWGYSNDWGMTLSLSLVSGSDFQTTPNTWQSANYVGTSNIVNFLDSTSNYLRIDLIQVEPGIVVTPFEIKLYEDILSQCQRYLRKTFNQGVTPAQASGTQVGAISYRATLAGINASGQLYAFENGMRTTPSMTFYNPVNANGLWYNVTLAADSGAASLVNAGDRGSYIGNAQVVGDAVTNVISIHALASAEL